MMKNQYFGDRRDLFKYDLAMWVIKEVDCLGSFVFVPMLTENDNRSDGQKTKYPESKPGGRNGELRAFLGECVRQGRRRIAEIRPYFSEHKIPMTIYKENEYFINRTRGDYFSSLKEEIRPGSLILLDPDNGLEVKSKSNKHLLFAELWDIYSQMDEGSVLMIYQHFTRQKHEEYLEWRAGQLSSLSGTRPLHVTDNEIIFFFVCKDSDVREGLKEAIGAYKEEYPL
jgi:hypothetical protein